VTIGWPSPPPTERASRRLLFAPVLLVVLGVAWFALPFLSLGDLPSGQVEATLHPAVSVEGRSVRVTGTTDLPDGAVIDFYYWHELDSVNDRNDSHGSDATVRSGTFEFETDLTDWPGGTVTMIATFSVAWGTEQPQVVLDRFGSKGERLAGPQVHVDSPGDPKQLLVTATFELPPAPTPSAR
jgi:hypothetical protein